jgi:hypothetical protein
VIVPSILFDIGHFTYVKRINMNSHSGTSKGILLGCMPQQNVSQPGKRGRWFKNDLWLNFEKGKGVEIALHNKKNPPVFIVIENVPALVSA